MYKNIYLFILIFMFGLKPVIADEEIKSYYGRSSTGNVEVDLHSEGEFDEFRDYPEVGDEVLDVPEVGLVKAFVVNLIDYVENDGNDLEFVVERVGSLFLTRDHYLEDLVVNFGKEIAYHVEVMPLEDLVEIEGALQTLPALYNPTTEFPPGIDGERLKALKTVLDFVNLNPNDNFLRELDTILVSEVAYGFAEFGRISQIMAEKSDVDFDEEMGTRLEPVEKLGTILMTNFMNEMMVRDIPIDMIIRVLASSPDLMKDTEAQKIIFGFLMEHGPQIKAVINDFIDNSKELNQILLILDDAIAFAIDHELLNEIPNQLAHLEEVLQRIIDLPYHETNINAFISSGLTLVVDFVKKDIVLNEGNHIRNYLQADIEVIDYTLDQINMLFDKENAMLLLYNPDAIEDGRFKDLIVSGVFDQILDVAMRELFDATENIVKLVNKMPKTSEFMGNSLQSGSSILGQVDFIVNKLGNKVDELLPEHIEKIEDESIRNMIDVDLEINAKLAETLIGIILESINKN
jgi:hypothetical protein